MLNSSLSQTDIVKTWLLFVGVHPNKKNKNSHLLVDVKMTIKRIMQNKNWSNRIYLSCMSMGPRMVSVYFWRHHSRAFENSFRLTVILLNENGSVCFLQNCGASNLVFSTKIIQSSQCCVKNTAENSIFHCWSPKESFFIFSQNWKSSKMLPIEPQIFEEFVLLWNNI